MDSGEVSRPQSRSSSVTGLEFKPGSVCLPLLTWKLQEEHFCPAKSLLLVFVPVFVLSTVNIFAFD